MLGSVVSQGLPVIAVRNQPGPSCSRSESAAGHGSKEVKGKTHTYYQVLIDARDCPHISQRSQTEAVTFLANHDDSRALYAIPGLDYVSHEDILPYTSTDQVPIQHELFERFLLYDQTKAPPFVARDTLCAWQEKNHPWLELSDVHRETTENIRVTVIPFYMGMREAQNSHVYWVSLPVLMAALVDWGWGGQGAGEASLCPSEGRGDPPGLSDVGPTLCLPSSGATASAWKTSTMKLCSSESGTGGYSACLALWRPSVAGAWWVG
uniref:DNA polymerase delta interacting protein 2 n=1 Tax=Laticauda laticaudata TaxID=8630 RepID=A0A8C5RCU3_LATLA